REYPRERLLTDGPRQRHGGMPRRQPVRRLCRIRQFIIGKARTISHRVSRPRTPVQIHQGEQEPGVDATAEQQANRYVADELPLNSLFIEREQLFFSFAVRLYRCKWSRLRSVPSPQAMRAVFERYHGAWRELLYALE